MSKAKEVSPYTYPTRAQIVDVDGETWNGLEIATPEVSRPHVGKFGWAALDSDGDVVLMLDDHTVLYGSECWWESRP